MNSSAELEKVSETEYKIVDSNNTRAVDTTSTWKTSHAEVITITDEHSGLAEGAEIQYGWSTSETTEPSSWTTTQITGYTAGANTASIEVTESEITGEYYLWVKPVQVKDTAVEGGNAQTEIEKSADQYWFDNTKPTVQASYENKNVTITLADEGSGLTSDGGRYYLSMSNTELTGGSWKEYTSAAANAINDLTGKYYLFVEKVSDNVGNISEQEGTLTQINGTEYHMFGPFTFDNTAPTLEITPTESKTWTKDKNVEITLKDETALSKGTLSFSYAWSQSNTVMPDYYVWKTEDSSISVNEAGATTATTTVQNGYGLTGKYYLWIMPYGYNDLAGNSLSTEPIVSGEFWLDNTAPTVQINNTGITAADYGGYVTNYVSINEEDHGANINWRIFHADGETVYLIAEECINNTYVPAGASGSTVHTNGTYAIDLEPGYSYSASEGDLPTAIRDGKIYTTGSDGNTSVGAVAYLVDMQAWSNFQDKNGYASYAIGTPTVDLFVQSYNALNEQDINTKIATCSPGTNGYTVKWDNPSSDYSSSISGLSTTKDLYVTDRDMWLAGAYIYESEMMCVNNNSITCMYMGTSESTYGVRPVVALNPDYKLEKQANGTYLIVENQNRQWAKTQTETIVISDEHSGLAQGAEIQYGWADEPGHYPTDWKTAIVSGYEQGAKTANITITETEKLTGKYYLFIEGVNIYDMAGNDAGHPSQTSESTYWFDNTLPTVTATPNKTDGYVKTQDVRITLTDEGSGLASAQGEYYLSSNEEQLVDGEWKTYTSGTAFTIGENLTGTYYLYVKTVSDNVTNSSNQYGTIKTIGQDKYHMFGPYQFDNTVPTVTFNPNGNLTPEQSQSTVVTVVDLGESSALNNESIKYIWKENEQEPTEADWNQATIFASGDTIETNGKNGGYYLWVMASDNTGNTIITHSDVFKFDNIKPILTVEPSTQLDVVENITQTVITITKTGESNLASTNEYKYFLSTSSEPTVKGEEKAYESGKVISKLGDGLTGTYYLFIKQVSDEARNLSEAEGALVEIAGEKWHRFGEYLFDNEIPQVTFGTNGSTTWSQEYTTTVTLEDTPSGLNAETLKYMWTRSETAPTNWSNATAFTNGATISSTEAGESGENRKSGDDWRLWIKAEDNLGHTVITSTNPFYLDNVKPVITATPNENPSNGQNQNVVKELSVTVNVNDPVDPSNSENLSGLKENNTYQYYLSTSNTSLEGASLQSYTSGTAFTIGTGLTGTRYLFVRTVFDNANNESGESLITSDGANYQLVGTYIFDNTGPAISFDPDGNATWKQEHTTDVTVQENTETEVGGGSGNESDSTNGVTADTLPVEDYGKYVTNYVPTNGVNDEGIGWRIFHADTEDDNIYLIADTYVPVENYVPTGYSSTSGDYGFDLYGYENYNGTEDIASKIVNKWLKKYTTAGHTATNTYENGKATAYLLDTNAWSGFKDSTYAAYAVGAPTIELFAASYNKTHPSRTIETQVNRTGYDVKWSDGSFGDYYISGLDTSESLYVISDTFDDTVYGMWLASPSGIYGGLVMGVDYYGGGVSYGDCNGSDLRCPPASFSKINCTTRTTTRRQLQNIRRNTSSSSSKRNSSKSYRNSRSKNIYNQIQMGTRNGRNNSSKLRKWRRKSIHNYKRCNRNNN